MRSLTKLPNNLLSNEQKTFAKYTKRTAFERPLTSGVAYAVRVLHSEREQFEYNPEELEPSPIQQEYAPVIFAQDTIAHVISLDMMSGKVLISFLLFQGKTQRGKNEMFNLCFVSSGINRKIVKTCCVLGH